MWPIVAGIGKFILKRPLMTAGAALLGDHFLTDGKGRELAAEKVVEPGWENHVKPFFKEKAGQIAEGVQEHGLEALEKTWEKIKGLFEKIGLGPSLGFGAGMLVGGGGVMQRLIVGIALAGAVYIGQQYFLKNDFNNNASADTPEVALNADHKNTAGTSGEFNQNVVQPMKINARLGRSINGKIQEMKLSTDSGVEHLEAEPT
jgi:hypothetical protein